MTKYRNSFYRSSLANAYGPEFYETSAPGVEYRGHLIFERIPGSCWDIVSDGVCIHQRAGLNGARDAIDRRLTIMSQETA